MQLLGMKNITERPANAPSQEEEKTKFMDDICEKIINTVWQDFGLKALTKAVADTDSEAEQQYEYCFCHEELDDECTMIACENPECENKWFHLECIGLTPEEIDDEEPWYCSDGCRTRYKYCICKTDTKEAMVECGNSTCPKGAWFHWSCMNLTESDIPKGKAKWYCCESCKNVKGKRKGKQKEDKKDYKFNYMSGLLWRGLNDRIRKTATRTGDGPAMIRFWKIDLIEFFARHHTKYVILAHRLIAGINGWLPTKLRHDITWNRTVNYSGGSHGNLPMDLVNEYLNKEFVMSLRKTGQLSTDTVDRHGMLVGSLRKCIDNLYSEFSGGKVWSAKGGKADRETDVLHLAKSLLQTKPFVKIPGRAFKAYQDFHYWVVINDSKGFKDKLVKMSKKLDVRRRLLAQ